LATSIEIVPTRSTGSGTSGAHQGPAHLSGELGFVFDQ
jgi:hypothetical protein